MFSKIAAKDSVKDSVKHSFKHCVKNCVRDSVKHSVKKRTKENNNPNLNQKKKIVKQWNLTDSNDNQLLRKPPANHTSHKSTSSVQT